VDRKEQIVVGVNAFQVEEEQHLERLRVDPTIEEQQRRRLADLRARRDNGKVAELRVRLESAARGSESLMPLFIECVEHNVTLGEICSTLRGVFGEYKPSVII
jgi:methylmalonyl-CoA mutase N-terminal domain/subunit